MKDLLAANVRSHARRYLATGLAVTISTAFVVACLFFTSALAEGLIAQTRSAYTGAAIAISLDEDTDADLPASGLEGVAEKVATVPGVSAVGYERSALVSLNVGSTRIKKGLTTLLPEPLAQPRLVRGALPTDGHGIVLDEESARILGVGVGGQVEFTDLAGGRGSDQSGRTLGGSASGHSAPTLTVTGISPAVRSGMASVRMSAEGVRQLGLGTYIRSVLVAGDGLNFAEESPVSAADSAALTAAVKKVLADEPGYVVLPAQTALEAQLDKGKVGVVSSAGVILLFPGIATLVSAIVVATTFQVILAQRRRELALLRAIGARSRQVRSLVLLEALVVGAVSSLVGTVLGTVITAASLVPLGVARDAGEALALVPWFVVAGTGLGATVLTALLGLRPALAVSGVAPMVALSPVDEAAPSARRSTIGRMVVGLVLAAGGGVAMWFGLADTDPTRGFLITFLGGLVTWIGTLFICSACLPAITGAVGLAVRGPVGEMARGNTLRNPSRTAATGTAVVIGVTLITMMAVGATSVRATLEGEVDARRPFDLVVQSIEGDVRPGLLERIASTDGIEAVAPVRGVTAELRTGGFSIPVSLMGVPDLQKVAHSEVSAVKEHLVQLPQDDHSIAGPVTVCAGGSTAAGGEAGHGAQARCVDLEAETSTEVTTGAAMVSEAVLATIAPDAPVVRVIVKLAPAADAEVVQSALLSLDAQVDVNGAALERAMYGRMIDLVLAIVVGLLAVSVVVALVGVTNTLSLSVHERTRENGLLRALGMTRASMRRMLALEAVLVSLTASLVGLALGVFFGVVGTWAIPLDVITTHIVIPWQVVAATVVVAVLAATTASWLPGRRASRTSPVEALAAL
ncbi:FtsX-like permease family protein [Schaalia sp. 19OD2882]|uniref:FtsX-like permease family protein n=1 Tax=Schaalia sp. 19OD2882 TaxID=2794089 RepID=UPI001C1F0287|nr:FtsX-like permease family protein [Schaalia sp. 19OD2882]QWW19549.1 FtsX-like permease family protein [Schaalia sp. 19OD2882]